MPGKENRDEMTPEECRQDAENRKKKLKSQWIIFLRVGVIAVVAFIAVVVGSIAWFMSNNKVGGTGASIQASGGEYDIAAVGEDVSSTKGQYDKLLDSKPGEPTTVEAQSYIATNDNKPSITWAITEGTNMKNMQNTESGLEPGSCGSMTFYIIPHKSGQLDVKLDLTLTGYTYKGDKEPVSSDGITKIDPKVQQLLEGHILLFAGYDKSMNAYSGWISDDADAWSLSLDAENNITLSRNGSGDIIWSAEKIEKDKAYPVTIYWIWPEILESYLKKADNISRHPSLFPNDSSAENTDDPGALPKDLYTTMCKTGSGSTFNRYFRWENEEVFEKSVTSEKLANMRKNMNPAIYGEMSAYYNLADQYLGENVRYVKLKLETR